MELIGIFFVASGLLVLAGIAKALRPDDTARALVVLLPSSARSGPSFHFIRHVVRLGALAEALLGMCALLSPQPAIAVLVAISYTAFLCLVVYARRRGGPLSTCGCFGRPDTPATPLHVLLNCLFVTAGVVVAVHQPQGAWTMSLLANQPWHGLPILFASGVGTSLSYLVLSPLATLDAARRMVARTGPEVLST